MYICIYSNEQINQYICNVDTYKCIQVLAAIAASFCPARARGTSPASNATWWRLRGVQVPARWCTPPPRAVREWMGSAAQGRSHADCKITNLCSLLSPCMDLRVALQVSSVSKTDTA